MQNDDRSRITPFPLARARPRPRPFPHFVASQVFAPEILDAAYAWLDGWAPWRRHLTSFFDQFEVDLPSKQMPPLVREGLTSPATLRFFRRRMEALFGVPFANVFSVIGHRLVPGQGIGVHNDSPERGDETHRMVVHLGPTVPDSNGGHLLFFNSADRRDIAYGFRGVHNTAVGFECCSKSHHAVTEVTAGVRYTLVYSFWRKDWAEAAEPHGERIEDDDWQPATVQETYQAPHAADGRPLDALIRVLVEAGAARTPDPEPAVLPGLVAAYEQLRRWRRSDAVCLAGLFYGVYGGERSPCRLIPSDQRGRVRDAIGERAEALVYACCAASSESLKRALAHNDPSIVEDRWRRTSLEIDRETLVDLATLNLADRVARHSKITPPGDEWDDEIELAKPHLDAGVLETLRRT